MQIPLGPHNKKGTPFYKHLVELSLGKVLVISVESHIKKYGRLSNFNSFFTQNGHFTSSILTPQQSHETKPSGEAPKNGTLGFMKIPVSCIFTFT